MSVAEIIDIVIISIPFIGLIILGCILLAHLQKSVMKLDRKIFHFVPVIFYAIQFIYGILRTNGIIIYYTDMWSYGFGSSDWQEDGIIFCFLSAQGFVVSSVILITAYFRNKKFTVVTAKKSPKIFAGILTVFLIAFSGVYSYEMISYPYGSDTDFQNQKLLTIGKYMFDELHSGNFDLNKYIYSEDIENIKSDSYTAFKYTPFNEVYFLDEHTVCIYESALFDSMKGYIVTDGQKDYSTPFYKIKGYDNLYSWSGETHPEYWNNARGAKN